MKGQRGPAPTISAGTVNTVDSTAPAAVSINSSSNSGNYTINFDIPRGATGHTPLITVDNEVTMLEPKQPAKVEDTYS